MTVRRLKALIYLQVLGDVDVPLKCLTKEKLVEIGCYVTLTINSHTHIFKRIFNTYQTPNTTMTTTEKHILFFR